MKKRSEIASILGQTVRKERELRHISQEAFADKCGLHRTYMSSIERGERNISIVNICKIARGLELSAAQLLEKAEL